MAVAPDKLLTAQELYDLGDVGPCELIRGELIRMSPANPRHGVLAGFLCHVLAQHVRGAKLGRVFGAETGFKIASNPDTVRAPDVAFVAAERARNLPKRGYFHGAPDLAVEVISPEDRWSDVQEKTRAWLDAGCQSVWIVDPQSETVTIHTAATACVLKADDLIKCPGLLPGFQIGVAQIFAELCD